MINNSVLKMLTMDDLDEIGYVLNVKRFLGEDDPKYRIRLEKALNQYKLKYGDKIGIA